ncbi:MAG: hypothetical protein BAA01_03850 [Bacillus thermozeamaize]|jgi:acyl-CoA thioester hydrolase|uniref:Uncharacterized protein n=1 Tax=Bacillus thermozeamaize TaxID=230954 RepID=A0A1Y3PKR8_9BACI|nr:MAG: hypothetical protein BAA01_03850 [Bacillus thermozeamaize]
MSATTEVRLAVRYQETDQMAIVYHANYLVWFEIGRTDFVKQVTGMGYPDLEKQYGVLLPVIHVEADYHAPARYGDAILVRTRMVQFSRVRIHFAYEVLREVDGKGEELLVTGQTHHAWVNRELKPLRLDRHAPAFFSRLQEAMAQQP